MLAVLTDGDGQRTCSQMWPGSTADVTTLIPLIDRLRKRFAIRRACMVAERGMSSAETVAELETHDLLYILVCASARTKSYASWCSTIRLPLVPLMIDKSRRLQSKGRDSGW